MNSHFFAILFFSILTISAHGQNMTWDEEGKKRDALLIQAIPEKYEKTSGVALFFEGMVKINKISTPACRLVNNSAKTVYFTGYGIDSPWCRMQKWNGKDWIECATGWCGLGARTPELPENKSVIFPIYPRQDVSVFRIGLILVDPANRGKKEEDLPTVWSEKIELSKN